MVDTIASFCGARGIPAVLPRLPTSTRSESVVACWRNGVGAALRRELTGPCDARFNTMCL